MKKIIGCFLVILLSYFAIRPLLSTGYFPMHDDTQVARVVVMEKALKQGQFPVRWVSDLGYGYGYPLFNFYGPLPYYVGGGLAALGVDPVVATKIMFAIGLVVAPISLFILVESIFGFSAAMVASMLFLYAPYHAVEAYIRGSVGEYWAIAFVPLLLYGLKLSLEKKYVTKGMIIGGLSLAAVIVSHTILGFVTCVLLGIGLIAYWLIAFLKKKLILSSMIRPTILILLGLGISAFFWLPAIVELPATSVTSMIEGANTNFFDHFVCVGQLWNSPWGYGGSAPGCVDGMSFKLGKWQIVIGAISFGIWFFLKKKSFLKEKNRMMQISAVVLGICILLMLQISSPLWKMFPLTSFIQYPWRLLAFCMLFLAICGAYMVSVARMPIIRISLMVAIIMVTILVNAKIFTPQYIYSRDSAAFETLEELRFTKSKLSDEYLPPGIVKPQIALNAVKTTLEGNATFFVRAMSETDTSLYAQIDSTAAQIVTLKKAWFPGWKIMVNKKLLVPVIKQGMPTVNIPVGMSIIQMRFTDTPIRIIGNILSICTGIVVSLLFIYGKKTNA